MSPREAKRKRTPREKSTHFWIYFPEGKPEMPEKASRERVDPNGGRG